MDASWEGRLRISEIKVSNWQIRSQVETEIELGFWNWMISSCLPSFLPSFTVPPQSSPLLNLLQNRASSSSHGFLFSFFLPLMRPFEFHYQTECTFFTPLFLPGKNNNNIATTVLSIFFIKRRNSSPTWLSSDYSTFK